MKKLELTPRLHLLAEWVPEGARFADIGTDHGYLPVWLLLSGKIRSAIAGDLRAAPLEHAKKTAETYGVSQGIEFRLCSGLTRIHPWETDTIAIAGMGGENIAMILSRAPWTRDGKHLLILQPMSREDVLRRYLSDHGYAIMREQLVFDRDTIYPVMLVCAGEMSLTDGQCCAGAALVRDPLEDRYLIEHIIRLQNAVAGLNHSELPAERERADRIRERIRQLLSMREEWRHANCGNH